MRVLIVGGGGREHALAHAIRMDAEVFAAPGNPGISEIGTCLPVAANDLEGILELGRRIEPDLTIVGPEDPLLAGLADRMRADGRLVLGPDQAAARLEGSKAFSKELMLESGVRTAAHRSFDSAEAARRYVREEFENGRQVVVKASGAALGKGALVCEDLEQALEAIESLMIRRELGEAGARVVIEQRLLGREFSLMSLVNDRGLSSLPVAQDYKRALDGDGGANTGGMGSASPVPWVSPAMVREAEEEVALPIVRALARRGTPFRGLLFSGLMVCDDGVFCLEYNVRFGDPETQSIVRRLGPGFLTAMHACASGEEIPAIPTLDEAAVSVVVASEGYPGSYEKGRLVEIGAMPEGVIVFHAGTAFAESGSGLVNSGGRVLAVSATAKTVAQARSLAYEGVSRVSLTGAIYRKDIAADLL